MTLNDIWARLKVIVSCHKNGEIQLSNDSDAMWSGWRHYFYNTELYSPEVGSKK